MDTRYLNKQFLKNFIDAYRNNPCLWKVGTKDYTNRSLKLKAYEEMAEICKDVFGEVDKTFVIRKIQALRGCFRKEYNKVRKSKQNGGKTYVPQLWYYNLLLFTKDEEVESADEDLIDEPDIVYEDLGEDNLGGPETIDDSDNTSSEKEDEKESPVSGRKRRKLASKSSSLQHVKVLTANPKKPVDYEILNAHELTRVTTNQDEYVAIGVTVTAKLRKMEEMQRIYAENLIHQVLFKGQLKKLSELTTINDGSGTDLSINNLVTNHINNSQEIISGL